MALASAKSMVGSKVHLLRTEVEIGGYFCWLSSLQKDILLIYEDGLKFVYSLILVQRI